MNNLIKKSVSVIKESKKTENKSLYRVLIDIINYSTRLGLSPGEYFSYGFQLKSSSLNHVMEYLPSTVHFTKHLSALNPTGRDILYDKLLFKNELTNKKILLPNTIGYIGPAKRDDIGFDYITPQSIEYVLTENNVTEFIIKPAKGTQGRGVFSVIYTAYMNNPFCIKNQTFDTAGFFNFITEFEKSDKNEYFIIEQLISSPPAIKNISPDATPNIRIITLRTPGSDVHITNTSIRLGRTNAVTANSGSGGLIGYIDRDSGEIVSCKTNASSSGQFVSSHPDTGVHLIGFKIPYWHELLEECRKVASLIDSVNSIGWDVLITDNGPIILEGNDDWCVISPQLFGYGYLSSSIRSLLSEYGLEFPEHRLPNPTWKNAKASLFGLKT